MTEKEIKYQLSKKDFNLVKEHMNIHGTKESVVCQKNYYFDNDTFDFKNSGITIRIRIKDDLSCEFTVKTKIKAEGNYKVKREYNTSLNIEEANEIIKKANLYEFQYLFEKCEREDRDTFLTKDIKLLGCLETKRIICTLDGEDGIICLDESQYLDDKDYELEWETESYKTAMLRLEEIFKSLGVEPYTTCISKSSRFISRYVEADKIKV